MLFEASEYVDELFEHVTISKQRIKSKEFDNCLFKNCTFNATVFEYCKFVECRFEDCDLSLITIKGTIFNDVIIQKCKAIGINWSHVQEPFEINFEQSNISMSSFYRLNLKHIQIISCTAHEVDFVESNLEKANLKDTDLLNALFDQTNLNYADLSKAKNYLIDPKINSLKKTKVSLDEATSFLKFLDLDIID